VSSTNVVGEVYGYADASFADYSTNRKSTLAYFLFVENEDYLIFICYTSYLY